MSGRKILTQLGGVAATAELLGEPYTTVRYWWEQDRIPSGRQQQVLDAGKPYGVKPSSFFGAGNA